MDKWDEALEEIMLNGPEFADIKAPTHRATHSDRLLKSFDEITDFVERKGRVPSSNGDLSEKSLARRLQSIMDDKTKYDSCKPIDRLNILGEFQEKSIDEQLESIIDDPIFDETPESRALFDIPDYMRKAEERARAEYIGGRKPCHDFEKYERLFVQLQEDIDLGRKKLVQFKDSDLQEGAFFVDHGQKVFLERIDTSEIRMGRERHKRQDGRVRCIYDNGTESDILFRSLAKSIHLDGYSIRDCSIADEEVLKQSFTVTDSDVESGYIYVLKSKSTDPQISRIKNLYKIGFTTQTVEKRIANAKNESTYLFADVEIMYSWRVYNIKAVVIENALHKLFVKAQLQLSAGEKRPVEWYVVPLPQIEEGINRLIRGEHIGYEPNFQKIITEE